MRVLVIDDEPVIRSIVSAALEGYAEVLEADDGLAGLAILAEARVDVVLLDVMMPGMSGYEVLSLLRRSPDHVDVAVIMLTAKAGETDHVTAYRTGADGYLTKPFDIIVLCQTVAEVARRGPDQRVAVRRAELSRAELLRQLEHQFGL
ncbi:MAG TPA: response regulator [Egibacteraceae bacterium]|jgi:two-component system, cell cycle response regulator|nr:response regulator [Egibacteraceae bacterium]